MIVLLLASAAGAGYLTLALVRVALFARRPFPETTTTPSMTILKPLYGDEPGLYENLLTFCDQDYPDFELVLCVHDEADSAAPVAHRVARERPQCRIRIVYGENPTLANPKIANLAKPGAEPHGEIVVIVDSDMRVDRRYCAAVAAAFADERVGAMTCLYGGLPNATVVSMLGAIHVEDEFAPSVLVALALGKLAFCFGATMAVRAPVLEKIGGLAALGVDITDDYTLGRLVSERGFEVALSRYVVHTTIPETKLAQLWEHEVRWGRNNFTKAPAGYAFSFLMYALPLAFLYAVIARTPFALALFALVAVLRYTLHYAARATFAGEHRDALWLVPVRDCLSLGVWAASLFTRNVRWRGVRHRT